jgi:hypothetical protein
VDSVGEALHHFVALGCLAYEDRDGAAGSGRDFLDQTESYDVSGIARIVYLRECFENRFG